MLLMGEGYVCVGAGGIWEISVPSSQFCCKPKTALKNKIYLNVKNIAEKFPKFEKYINL